MITNQKELYSFINSVLTPCQFVKKGEDWYYTTNDCVSAIGIGKSKWGGQYAIVLTTTVREIDNTEFPKTHQSHIHGFSLENLIQDKNEFKKALDIEEKFQDGEREEILRNVLMEKAVPFVKVISTVNGLKQAIKEYDSLRYHIVLKLQDFLGVRPK